MYVSCPHSHPVCQLLLFSIRHFLVFVFTVLKYKKACPWLFFFVGDDVCRRRWEVCSRPTKSITALLRSLRQGPEAFFLYQSAPVDAKGCSLMQKAPNGVDGGLSSHLNPHGGQVVIN